MKGERKMADKKEEKISVSLTAEELALEINALERDKDVDLFKRTIIGQKKMQLLHDKIEAYNKLTNKDEGKGEK